MPSQISRTLRDRVAAQAGHRCGYCLTDQRVSGAQMQVEHIIPRAAGGTSEVENLWLSCAWCNSYKGTKVSGRDSITGLEVPLFNPRTQAWKDHFRWDEEGVHIRGLTPIGRVAVDVLQLNNSFIVPARRLWVIAGWHPPQFL